MFSKIKEQLAYTVAIGTLAFCIGYTVFGLTMAAM